MKRASFVVTAATLIAAFGPTPALADIEFSQADTNHDGKVTLREAEFVYPNLSKRIFDQVDDDHNGWLDESEFGELAGLSGAIGGGHR